jgi:hypothetical protein
MEIVCGNNYVDISADRCSAVRVRDIYHGHASLNDKQYTGMAVFWVIAPCSLVEVYQRFRGACCLHHQGDEWMMMEAARTSETLVNVYQTTRCYSPEDSHLRTYRRENLKSYLIYREIANSNRRGMSKAR